MDIVLIFSFYKKNSCRHKMKTTEKKPFWVIVAYNFVLGLFIFLKWSFEVVLIFLGLPVSLRCTRNFCIKYDVIRIHRSFTNTLLRIHLQYCLWTIIAIKGFSVVVHVHIFYVMQACTKNLEYISLYWLILLKGHFHLCWVFPSWSKF